MQLKGSVREVERAPGTGPVNPHRPMIVRTNLHADESAAAMDIEMVLKMRDFAELRERVAHREHISAAEMQSRYEPAGANYQAAVDWLTRAGLTITRRDPHHMAVFARGTVAQLASALQVNFARVSLDGQEFTSATSEPKVPALLSPLLLGINGLQTHIRYHKHIILRPNSLGGTSEPYLPGQILQAYQGNIPNIAGTGQTTAIVIDTFPLASDLTSFWQTYGVSQNINNVTFVQVVSGTLPSPSGEETLDTEWSSSIAPGSKVRIYAVKDLSDTDIPWALAVLCVLLFSVSILRHRPGRA